MPRKLMRQTTFASFILPFDPKQICTSVSLFHSFSHLNIINNNKNMNNNEESANEMQIEGNNRKMRNLFKK